MEFTLYFFIAIPILSANLSANLLSINHTLRKRERSQKKTGPAIAILHSDIEDVIEPLKRTCLFLKPPRPPPNTDEIAINITKVSNKIIKPDTYEKVIEDSIHIVY